MNTRKTGTGKGRTTTGRGSKPTSSRTGKPAPKGAKPKSASKPAAAAEGSSKPHFKPKVRKGDPLPTFNEEDVRLNKYLSNAGVCSRREADVLIQTGVVSVNGEIVTELGYKIKKGDKVQYDGETINAETKRYVLLNKPKGFITTMDDPLGRKTVMGLVINACKERIYPVGRLDRDTTGLLLFTNDGDMAKKLTHPRYEATKIYHVETDKPVQKEHLELLMRGIELEDGRIQADKAEYVTDGKSGREVGIEIHSGKNRIVRRMFEKLGYEVVKLDRVQFASLTKKDLPRGYYRHLTEKEVSFLKMTK
ncbi:pseudouridine synthase [Fluviicola sp.]|uniref:pseudouridine synthase n=1 Tax=Fluviicola sp. TaxID=1917219 RepID=UPI0031E20BC4